MIVNKKKEVNCVSLKFSDDGDFCFRKVGILAVEYPTHNNRLLTETSLGIVETLRELNNGILVVDLSIFVSC